MIHNCDQCDAPILIYGRMIPCKHVFCYKCALAAFNQTSTQDSSADTRTTNASVQGTTKRCPRCKDKVVRVEQAGLGSIYMCQHGGSRSAHYHQPFLVSYFFIIYMVTGAFFSTRPAANTTSYLNTVFFFNLST